MSAWRKTYGHALHDRVPDSHAKEKVVRARAPCEPLTSDGAACGGDSKHTSFSARVAMQCTYRQHRYTLCTSRILLFNALACFAIRLSIALLVWETSRPVRARTTGGADSTPVFARVAI